ncbi:MAG: TIGR01212 family radical SAM protein [Deltaproteobacteria bacterium]|nr:TIGR01212 family radical SAM protein [Deltaproteobacteria bacterium]
MNANLTIPRPYNALSAHLKERYGCRVFKVSINAGFTCPNRDGAKGVDGCIYCESSALLPKGLPVGLDVSSQLSAGIRYVRERHKADKFIAYFQINTNTYAPAPVLRGIYGPATAHPDVAAIAVSTRPDCLETDAIDVLSEIKRKKDLWLELGLQSASDATLERLNRLHTVKDFEEAAKRAMSAGIDVCGHVIIGLPGEGRDSVLNTVRFLNRVNVWGVKFHQLQILKGTALHALYEKGEVSPLALEEYADLVVDSLELLRPGTIVHRLCGDSPARFLDAPRWGANKFMIIERIKKLMAERRTWQGKKFEAD